MGALSCLWQQNSQSNQRGYRSLEFSSVLSKVQTGKFDRGKEFGYNDHQRAGRKDAEPMNEREKSRSSSALFNCVLLFCRARRFQLRLSRLL